MNELIHEPPTGQEVQGRSVRCSLSCSPEVGHTLTGESLPSTPTTAVGREQPVDNNLYVTLSLSQVTLCHCHTICHTVSHAVVIVCHIVCHSGCSLIALFVGNIEKCNKHFMLL